MSREHSKRNRLSLDDVLGLLEEEVTEEVIEIFCDGSDEELGMSEDEDELDFNSLTSVDVFRRQNGCQNFFDKLVIKVL